MAASAFHDRHECNVRLRLEHRTRALYFRYIKLGFT